MSNKMETVKSQIKAWCEVYDWKPDKYGNYQITKQANLSGETREYRMKFNDTSVRFEFKCRYSSGESEWVRILSGYYSGITVNLAEAKVVNGLKGMVQ